MLEGIQLGTIEGYAIPADFFAGADPRFGEFSIPFLFNSVEQANKVLADPEFNNYVLHMAENKGLVGVMLGVAAESFYFGAKKPLKHIADFKGLKLRVNATPAERDFICIFFLLLQIPPLLQPLFNDFFISAVARAYKNAGPFRFSGR